MKININGKSIDMVDCQFWSPGSGDPVCKKGLDLSGCATCSFLAPPIRQKPVGLLNKAASWVKAEASRFTHEMAEGEYESRIASCRSCDFLDAREEPQVGFCKACGCGENARAELTIKGKMPAATCPKGKWPVVP